MHSHAIPLTMARRLLSLRALLMVAVSVFLLSPSAPAVAAVSPAFAFVTDRGSGMIQTFEIFDSPGNPSDRALVPKRSLQMPLGMFPLTIKLSHSGRFAYVLTDGSPSVKPQILTYAVNPTTGELTLQGMVETTLPTGGLAVSPDDEFVYLTSAGASDALPGVTYYAIWWFAIDPQAGTLTVVDTVDVGTQPDDLTFDSTGQFLYVTLKNRNAMGMFGLDATGKPIPLNPPTVDTGLSPLPVALNPVRPFLYAANIANGVLGSVSSYQIEPKGTLTSLGAVDAGSFPGSIKVHPSGQFLYVANETPKGPTGNIMVYTIAATGTLNLLQTVSTGSSPRSMAFDASGTALYATNFHSNTVSMYRIDTVTGELSSLGIETVEAGAWPNDVATTPPEASPPPGQGPARNDVNGDGNSDILWLNIVTGDVVVWFMDGATIAGGGTVLAGVAPEWSIKGTGDFNGDGRADLLWRHSVTSNIEIWFMDGTTIASAVTILGLTPEWIIAMTADLDGDGNTDIVLRNQCVGDVASLFMDGATIVSSPTILPGVTFDWSIVLGPIIEQDPLCKVSG